METARLLRIGSSHHTCGSFRSTFTGANVVRAAPCRVAIPSRKCNVQEVRAAIIAEPAKLDVKTFKGDSLGSENLALKVADSSVAKGLVHRYIVLIRQNGRAGTASTKTRAEVRGGGRKPYAQKGTGNARQGSKRTPLRPGGGVVFGPRPCDWTIKMNKKERRLALATALQSAAANITIVDNLKDAVPEPKTKMVTAGLAAVGVDIEKESALLIVSDLFQNLRLASRNIQRLTINRTDLLSAYDVLRADKIIIEKSALKYIQDFFGGAKAVDVEEPQPVAA